MFWLLSLINSLGTGFLLIIHFIGKTLVLYAKHHVCEKDCTSSKNCNPNSLTRQLLSDTILYVQGCNITDRGDIEQTFPKKYFPVSPRTYINLLSISPSNDLFVLLIKVNNKPKYPASLRTDCKLFYTGPSRNLPVEDWGPTISEKSGNCSMGKP